MKCEVVYDKALRRGICHAPHKEGGGHYVRLPIWEVMVLPVAVLALLAALVIDFAPGRRSER